ncbi:MAG: phosphoribosylformylglycinamidine synthase [Eubacteriaceae bacterium]|nr:phosphoribosylformylglycinamidine synthase [Eubacteriaceae bacterium]
MVYRVFVEKRGDLAVEAKSLTEEIRTFLGITALEKVRLVNRYDAQGLTKELFDKCVTTVFAEMQVDDYYFELESEGACAAFAVEYLPGQYDQRADSAAQCIQIISVTERPIVKTAKVYLLYGKLTEGDIAAIQKHLINPVDSRLASMELPETLESVYDTPEAVEIIEGFTNFDEADLKEFIKSRSLAMDEDDLRLCRDHFKAEGRNPTITEIKVIDTYWSDHCRHTTFNTRIDEIIFEDEKVNEAYKDYLATREQLNRTKPICLMDMGTIVAKFLAAEGKLKNLDESEEINACTVKIKVNTQNGQEDWLLLFKNETHNHPTEIEPFGGAATCIGGAIRDPLSGRSYVYAAMRVTGAADPLAPLEQTLAGKLPQRKIVTSAAAGYSSYGNQIGLATGIVDEVYHPGYMAKHMEVGAVIGAAPAKNVRREAPAPGDKVILLGGRTGRDGIGGASGSSKAHTALSLENCGAEVQKGNAPEERKLQRLFRNPAASLMIKRCNDFGAGGVSVAIGELSAGVKIDLDKVTKKYEGLDGTELAISESQERMAVVVSPEDADKFIALADGENLEATVVAQITDEGRMVMDWRGSRIVDLSREFLDTNGAPKHISIKVASPKIADKKQQKSFAAAYLELAGDLNICSKRGLSERFDSNIGAGTVLMPFGGKYQKTPIQAMVHKIALEKGDTDTVSLMSYGFNPVISECDPFSGAFLAVTESIMKLAATGADLKDTYLTFQEYFGKPGSDPYKWGKPAAALLGAFSAQKQFEIAAIGGKDSMSGSFEDLDVPSTLISFAVTTQRAKDIISPEFKETGSSVIWLKPELDKYGLPLIEGAKALCDKACNLMRKGKVLSAYAPGVGGAAEAVMKMCFGNMRGFEFNPDIPAEKLFERGYGSLILELKGEMDLSEFARGAYKAEALGRTCERRALIYGEFSVALSEVLDKYEGKLESVYPCNIDYPEKAAVNYNYNAEKRAVCSAAGKIAAPRVLIPVFPGTNCEYDSAKAFEAAGAKAEIFVINNLSGAKMAESVNSFAQKIAASQIIMIPGGFSGGDEPEGSGKFITAFFRNPIIADAVNDLMKNRDGLMLGICNGFQALIKLGLVPFGEIIDADENCPTLTFNSIGRHQSKLVDTRIASNKSPWLSKTKPGEIYTVPISHGEGRFIISDELLADLAANGQIATQYVNKSGEATYEIQYNPNGSMAAIEGITSPDGRILGKMCHTERTGVNLLKNVPGRYDMGLFEGAVEYFG